MPTQAHAPKLAPKVAVIGLGAMGRAIAERLIDQGFAVSVYNRSRAAADEVAQRGAWAADRPAGAVVPGGIAISMVANDAALEAVTLGPDGILEALGPGGLHMSMSTVSPALAARLAAAHEAAGSHYLAAPVFGRPQAAGSGQLWVALAGSDAAKVQARPVVEAIGRGTFDFGGDPAAANVVKVAGNFLIAAAIESMSEAFALVEKHGIARQAFLDLFSQTLFTGPIYQNYGRFIVEQAFEPAGFKLALGLKDVELALAAGSASATPVPIASLLRDRMLTAVARGEGELDWTAVSRRSSEDAGL